MNFTTAVKSVLGKYAQFSGRATRPEFWYWCLALFGLNVVLAVVYGAFIAPLLGFEAFAPEAGQPLQMLASLALFLPSLGVAIRRLHDIDRSGWWLLVGMIPVLGLLVLLWWYTRPGTEGSNQFG